MNKIALVIFITLTLLLTALMIFVYKFENGHFCTDICYADAPHPFNDPDYPVKCWGLLPDNREDVFVTAQQGQTVLVIPRDAIFVIMRRSADLDCIPEHIELSYVWFKGKLLRSARDKSEAKDEGYNGVDFKRIKVEVKLINLGLSPEESLALLPKGDLPVDEKRYIPEYRMVHYPLLFYPNQFYDVDTHWGGGYGVVGTSSPRTGYPYQVVCNIDVPDEVSRERPIPPELLQRILESKMVTGFGGASCKNTILVDIGYSLLAAEITVYRDAVPYIDQIYPAVEVVIKSYATPVQPDT